MSQSDNPLSDSKLHTKNKKLFSILVGIALYFIMLSMPMPEGMNPESQAAAALLLLMAVWWMTEAIPLPVTALMPLLLLPWHEIATFRDAAAPFASPVIFLFLGGFMIAIAMEKWKLHKRIALNILKYAGTEAKWIVGGFMLATAFLSMWISNTATTVMMLPIALSVLALLDGESESGQSHKFFGKALLLGLAYAASIGGVATLVGTPPNVIMKGYFEDEYLINIDFFDWMKVGVPFALTMLVLTWLALTSLLFPLRGDKVAGATKIVRDQLKSLGKMTYEERWIAFIFMAVACLWVFKNPLLTMFDWLVLNDAMIAMGGALLMFLIPNRQQGEDAGYLVQWEDMQRVPWGILILFGGGLSMASAVNETGLADWIGAQVSSMGTVSAIALVIIITALIVFMTEIMTNIATITAFLPVIAAIAEGMGVNPLFVAIPATMAASCAFMMPVATAPNAIVFASGKLHMRDMVRAGVAINVLSIILVSLFGYGLSRIIFG